MSGLLLLLWLLCLSAAFLGFTGHFNIYLGAIVGLAVNIFSLWLLYNALVETLKAKPETTKIVMYVLIAIICYLFTGWTGSKKKSQPVYE